MPNLSEPLSKPRNIGEVFITSQNVLTRLRIRGAKIPDRVNQNAAVALRNFLPHQVRFPNPRLGHNSDNSLKPVIGIERAYVFASKVCGLTSVFSAACFALNSFHASRNLSPVSKLNISPKTMQFLYL